MYLKNYSQKGFSLTEVLVGVGLLGGLSLVTMKLMENQTNNEKNMKYAAEISRTVSLIQSAINNPEVCGKMFGDLELDGSVEYNVTELDQLKYPNAAGGDRVLLSSDNGSGYNNYGAFYLRKGDIKMQKVDETLAEIMIDFRVKIGGGAKGDFLTGNDRVLTRKIPIEVTWGTPSNKIIACGPVISDVNEAARMKFCESMDPNEMPSQITSEGLGAVWWDDVEKKCKLNDLTCPWGQVPQGMTSLGDVKCVDLENVIKLDQMFDPTPCTSPTGNYSITVGPDGRMKIQCL